MSSLGYESQRSAPRYGEDWRAYPPAVMPQERGGLSLGLILTGVAALGLGLVAWTYLGPDLRRYLKIRNM
jgi:hypothetical protein